MGASYEDPVGDFTSGAGWRDRLRGLGREQLEHEAGSPLRLAVAEVQDLHAELTQLF